MRISILTLFPEMFHGVFEHSIVKNAQKNGFVEIEIVNIRHFGIGRHKMVDDTPYGGGIGMVLRVDVLAEAIEKTQQKDTKAHVILLAAHGTPFIQEKAKSLMHHDHIILVCGHYEGVDERIKKWIDEEISIGDFITTGGEIPSMLMTDALTRLIPGVLKEGATDHESFSFEEKATGNKLLEYPHYTKPQAYKGMSVPDILLSGNHKEIAMWREAEAKKVTEKLRPDLLKK